MTTMASNSIGTSLRMWAIVQDGRIVGVFNSRNEARLQKFYYSGSAVKPVLVSLI